MSRQRRNPNYIAMYRPFAQTALDHISNSVASYFPEKNIDTKKMAQRRRYSRKSRKNQRKKKGIVKKFIPRSITPHKKLIKCKVSSYQTFTCTSGALGSIRVTANDITDPFGSYDTQQPLGYDQWKALYRTAYVLGCKVKVTLWNNQTTALVYGISMMDKNSGSTALNSYEYYREIPKTNSRLLSPDVDHGVIVNSQSTKRGLAVKDIIDNDTLRINLQTDAAPNENYYAHVWVQPLDQTTTLTGVQAVIDVEYIVLLTNPIIPARSAA